MKKVLLPVLIWLFAGAGCSTTSNSNSDTEGADTSSIQTPSNTLPQGDTSMPMDTARNYDTLPK